MTTLPKTLLAVSATAFVVGLTGVGGSIGWGILRPLSAVTFVLFLITKFLENEMALYDEETRLRMAQADGKPAASAASSRAINSSGQIGKNTTLTAAHSH